ncbi:MAG: hypothetical protein IJB97_06415 [Clostridia bacterium]|nr:hypothetical protein [Clostridia bacterium]
MIKLVLGFVLFLLVAVFVLAAILKSGKLRWRKNFLKQSKSGAIVSGVLAGVFGVALVFVPASFKTVEAGQVAVVKELGKAVTVRTAGTYFDFWVTKTYAYYDATVQNLEIETSAYSKDAQTMDIRMTVQYQINSEKAINIANEYGSLHTLSNRIQSVATEKAKARLSSYSAMNIIETRAEISPQVETDIKAAIGDNYFVTINTVVLTNIDFSDAFEKIVEDKMVAEQEKLKAEYEKETAIINAEKELEVAKKNAEATVAKAEADAEAQKLVAQAEAQAIAYKSIEVARMLGFTILETSSGETTEYRIDFTGKSDEEIKLISEYLKYVEYLDAWDGKLPSTVVTDSTGSSIILPTP